MGTPPRWLADLGDFVDARVRAIVGPQAQTVSSASCQFATVTQTDPLRIRLESGAVPLYAPPCAYPVSAGDRVVVASWGTDMAIIGPVAAGLDTGWQTATTWPDNGYTVLAGSDPAQWRQTGSVVRVRGAVQKSGSGNRFGSEVIIGVPFPAFGPQLCGTAQLGTGALAPLVITNDPSGLHLDATGATGDWTKTGWVRLNATWTLD